MGFTESCLLCVFGLWRVYTVKCCRSFMQEGFFFYIILVPSSQSRSFMINYHPASIYMQAMSSEEALQGETICLMCLCLFPVTVWSFPNLHSHQSYNVRHFLVTLLTYIMHTSHHGPQMLHLCVFKRLGTLLCVCINGTTEVRFIFYW